jgi:hypothetical protein
MGAPRREALRAFRRIARLPPRCVLSTVPRAFHRRAGE